MDIVALFCEIDDFCKGIEPRLASHLLSTRRRKRERRMHLSEVITLLVWFHVIGYRNFKQFYLQEVCKHLSNEFPTLVSYNRFVELQGDALVLRPASLLNIGSDNSYVCSRLCQDK